MIVGFIPRRPALALAVLLSMAGASHAARADAAAATACASSLSGDARTIFDATLPQVVPGINLRDVLTSSTRSLAIAGKIDRWSARESATAAAQCLERAI